MKFSLSDVQKFLVGFLLVPWIWIWGYYLFISIFLVFLFRSENYQTISREVISLYRHDVSLERFWEYTGFFLILNYSIAFFLTKKYQRLAPLLFFASLLLLFSLFFFAWPYLRLAYLQA